MSTFADSSALVKLYADEAGYEQVRGLVSIAIAQLARVEVPAALWRKQRMGELSAGDARLLTADFEADYFGTDSEPPRFAAVVVTGSLLDEAARLCASHGLRAYDAVQLSTALAVRRVDESCTEFAAFDRSLRTAAATEGFELMPSDLPDPETALERVRGLLARRGIGAGSLPGRAPEEPVGRHTHIANRDNAAVSSGTERRIRAPQGSVR